MTRPYTIYKKNTLEVTHSGYCPNAAYGSQLKDPINCAIAPVHCDLREDKIIIEDGQPKSVKCTKFEISERKKDKEDQTKQLKESDPNPYVKIAESEWKSILDRLTALEGA